MIPALLFALWLHPSGWDWTGVSKLWWGAVAIRFMCSLVRAFGGKRAFVQVLCECWRESTYSPHWAGAPEQLPVSLSMQAASPRRPVTCERWNLPLGSDDGLRRREENLLGENNPYNNGAEKPRTLLSFHHLLHNHQTVCFSFLMG